MSSPRKKRNRSHERGGEWESLEGTLLPYEETHPRMGSFRKLDALLATRHATQDGPLELAPEVRRPHRSVFQHASPQPPPRVRRSAPAGSLPDLIWVGAITMAVVITFLGAL